MLGLGDLLVVIGKRAGLGNPKAAGIYTFPLTIDRVAAAPRLRIV